MEFILNGNPVKVLNLHSIGNLSLNDYLRIHLNLTGTKACPLEGCSGGCVVSLHRLHPVSLEWQILAVNSCLFPLLCCADCKVQTIEGLRQENGNSYSAIKRVAAHCSNQCGNCAPANAMRIHTLLSKKSAVNVNVDTLEKELSGSLCNCFGQGFNTELIKGLVADYEALEFTLPEAKQETSPIKEWKYISGPFAFHRVKNLETLYQVLNEVNFAKNQCIFVGGNSERTLHQSFSGQVVIDLNQVKELKDHRVIDDELSIGGGFTFSELIDVMEKMASDKGFGYLTEAVELLERVGNSCLRNTATLAGNLVMKHKRPEFYSDLFVLLSTLESKITVANGIDESSFSPEEFLEQNIDKKVITRISFPKMNNSNHFLRTYKIMNGEINGDLYVNAAFLFKFELKSNEVNFNKLHSVTISYGGMNPQFTRAKKVETVLEGRDIFDQKVLQLAFKRLSKYLKPDSHSLHSSVEFRKQLAINLFYKSILSICSEESLPEILKSGATVFDCILPKSTYKFNSIQDLFPLTQPIPKLEALAQITGDIQYPNDLPHFPDDLYCCFVVAKKINHRFISANASEVLKMDGVVAFFDAKHIPGKNTFVSLSFPFVSEEEKLFLRARARIQYYSQPVGMIVAKTQSLAESAADLVELEYERLPGSSEGLTNMEKVLVSDDKTRIVVIKNAVDEIEPRNGTTIISSGYELGGQYDYPTGVYTTVCSPFGQDGMLVQSSTRPDALKAVLGEVLDIPNCKLSIDSLPSSGRTVLNQSRGVLYDAACAVACNQLRRRVRFCVSPKVALKTMGMRVGSMKSYYRVQVDQKGNITELFNDYYTDCGSSTNELRATATAVAFQSCYNADNYQFRMSAVLTDNPSNSCPYFAFDPLCMVENIMEHVAFVTKLDPIVVRLRNMAEDHPARKIYEGIIESAAYYDRKKAIDEFNKNNRWKKRGLGSMPLTSHVNALGHQEVVVRINPSDGSVLITHGGLEWGQDIRTKVTQITASVLQIPMEIVSVRSGGYSWNAIGGSTDQEVVYAVRKACEALRSRLVLIQDSLPGAKWPILIRSANDQGLDLTERCFLSKRDFPEHSIHAACVTEVELDVLTGCTSVRRVDILQDVGQSVNPLIDIDQIKQAFIKSTGFWLNEKPITDSDTGEVLGTGKWNNQAVGPNDFRVELVECEGNEKFSKVVGEHSFSLSWSIQPAVRYALNAARKDSGLDETFISLPTPCPPENILLLMATDINELNLERGQNIN